MGAVFAPRSISAIVRGFGTGGAGVMTGPKGFLVPVICGFSNGGLLLARLVRGVDADRGGTLVLDCIWDIVDNVELEGNAEAEAGNGSVCICCCCC